jgi:hypothetical protein
MASTNHRRRKRYGRTYLVCLTALETYPLLVHPLIIHLGEATCDHTNQRSYRVALIPSYVLLLLRIGTEHSEQA